MSRGRWAMVSMPLCLVNYLHMLISICWLRASLKIPLMALMNGTSFGFSEWTGHIHLGPSKDCEWCWVMRKKRENWSWYKQLQRKSQNGLTSWLVFEGLDTFCEIKLCNQTVGNTKNQFRKYTFDVSDILPKCSGDPVLSLNFGSASKIVLDIAQRSDLCKSSRWLNNSIQYRLRIPFVPLTEIY